MKFQNIIICLYFVLIKLDWSFLRGNQSAFASNARSQSLTFKFLYQTFVSFILVSEIMMLDKIINYVQRKNVFATQIFRNLAYIKTWNKQRKNKNLQRSVTFKWLVLLSPNFYKIISCAHFWVFHIIFSCFRIKFKPAKWNSERKLNIKVIIQKIKVSIFKHIL